MNFKFELIESLKENLDQISKAYHVLTLNLNLENFLHLKNYCLLSD